VTGGQQHRHGERPEAGPGGGAPGHRNERRPGPLGHRLQFGVGRADRHQPRAAPGRRLGGRECLRRPSGRRDRDHHVGGTHPAGDAGAAVRKHRHRATRPGHGLQHVAGAGGGTDAGHDDRARAALVDQRTEVGFGRQRRGLPHLRTGRGGCPQHLAGIGRHHRRLVVEQGVVGDAQPAHAGRAVERVH
jgi:hypothetical protein